MIQSSATKDLKVLRAQQSQQARSFKILYSSQMSRVSRYDFPRMTKKRCFVVTVSLLPLFLVFVYGCSCVTLDSRIDREQLINVFACRAFIRDDPDALPTIEPIAYLTNHLSECFTIARYERQVRGV